MAKAKKGKIKKFLNKINKIRIAIRRNMFYKTFARTPLDFFLPWASCAACSLVCGTTGAWAKGKK